MGYYNKSEKRVKSESIECTGGAYRNRTDVHGFSIRKFHFLMFFKYEKKDCISVIRGKFGGNY